MKKFNIVTFGCQINEYESNKFRETLLNLGLEEVPDAKNADIVLFNSCSVREKSEEKLLSGVGFVRSLYEKNGFPKSIVTGCVATTEEKKIKKVGKNSVLTILKGDEPLDERREKIFKLLNPVSGEAATKVAVTSKPFEFVPVIFGCNSFCTYCIVPITKGRERSRLLDDIIKEIKGFVEHGTKEIILLGQNINHYGLDLGNNNGFIELLEQVDKIEGLERIRFLTSHPASFNEEILKRMSNLKHICPHFHLPIQSGSNRILKLMNRGYTREDYITLINEIKKLFTDVSITTDIIVGFPTETDSDFIETKKLVKEIMFDKSFIAAYSKRPYTPAAKMEGQVDDKVKKERLNELLKIQNAISLEKNRAYIGKTVELLVEGFGNGLTFGRIPQDKLVIVEGKVGNLGDLINVKITDADFIHLRGFNYTFVPGTDV
jgi:tRNA-2-methylthio-N6-dimethylallyladenosine synthase